LESPDVTRKEAWRLLEVRLKALEVLRENAVRLRALANEKNPATVGLIEDDLDKAASLIQL
jgi:hypothetical protein